MPPDMPPVEHVQCVNLSVDMKERFEHAIAHNKRIVALIRHAERYERKKNTFGEELALTANGIQASIDLGKKLEGFPIKVVHTSPISRCVDTLDFLLEGADINCESKQTSVLGDPGPFTEDTELAGPVFLSRPLVDIVKDVAEGRGVPGMRSLEDGSKLFLDYALSIDEPFTIMVSHDVIIALITSFLFEDRDVAKYMPGFLEGVFIEYDSQNMTIYHKTGQRTLTWKAAAAFCKK